MSYRLPLLALALCLVPTSAGAAFHLWDIVEVYSNADGSVQYVEFYTDTDLEDLLTGHTLESDALPGPNNPFVFPNDLPSELTANKHFLVATPAFAAQCDQPFQPDYTFVAADFFDTVMDTLDFSVGTDTFAFTAGELPTDGYYALHEDFGDITGTTRAVNPNSPTNFAGQVCLPEPSEWLMHTAGLAGLVGLARWHRRRVR